jgi:hypothetical protein
MIKLDAAVLQNKKEKARSGEGKYMPTAAQLVNGADRL